jgi:hypothetical protein
MIPYNKSRKEQQIDKKMKDFYAWVESEAAKYQVTCDYILEEFVLNKKMIDLDYLSHEEIESLAEDAEDYLIERNIPLRSHSYVEIISQAVSHGFTS